MTKPIERLIVNSAYSEPSQHWRYSLEKGEFILETGRRPAGYFVSEQGSNQYNDIGRFVELPQVNDIRDRVKRWRLLGHPGVTGVTKKLLDHWNDSEQRTYPFFFCQMDAIETLIWLTEAPDSEKIGIEIDQGDNEFKRICSKMATGTGKTTVMAMLVAWQILNKVTYPQDKRFSKNIFIVTPGLTVKSRLAVLNPSNSSNYYDAFNIVPFSLKEKFNQGKVLVQNWHNLSWDDETAIKKRRSVDKRGPLSDEAYVRQVLGEMSKHNNIVIINDEAHHAWKRNPEIKIKYDKDDATLIKELEEQSTIWVGGLERISRARGILTCYDFSATPFAPSGKKNDETALFSWIVSDFGLNDAIESGLVKTPRMVADDDGLPNATTYKSKLYHIYGEDDVRKNLSRPAKPNEILPTLVLEAYHLLGHDWLKTYNDWMEVGSQIPPVMITVANRTETASRIEYAFKHDLIGIEELCQPEYICKIDSKTLKKIENEEITLDLQVIADPDSLTKDEQAALLRETVNTVGQIGQPGEQVRNIISVGMLSEGWDAKTVTHIMGLRAFSSQLLCEQVIGRGLRRTSYDVDENTGLFSAEYVNIFGIPFSFLPQESAEGTPKTPSPQTQIHVRSDKAQYSLEWPNVIRTDIEIKDELILDLDNIPPLSIGETTFISRADLAPFLGDRLYEGLSETIDLNTINNDEMRLQTAIFRAAAVLYEEEWASKGTRMCIMGQLIKAIEKFINSPRLVVLLDSCKDRNSPRFRALVFINIGRIINHIREYLTIVNTERKTIVLDSNRPVRSTEDMPTWYTKKPCSLIEKSHISHCVYDSTYETSDAYVLDHSEFVSAWAKNDHLGFEIPYMYNGGIRSYRPDFLVKLTNSHMLVLETKGKMTEEVQAKHRALQQWVDCVNESGNYGIWHCDFSLLETDLDAVLKKYAML